MTRLAGVMGLTLLRRLAVHPTVTVKLPLNTWIGIYSPGFRKPQTRFQPNVGANTNENRSNEDVACNVCSIVWHGGLDVRAGPARFQQGRNQNHKDRRQFLYAR